ncbi:MAG: hypothetical protein HN353_03010 [Bdellovibrionales bacterium]|jgi:hypothetical protein|nr:hypothetical protein [Bdellovibrionales bacterium]MBT3527124.1 hypothetical protein [Bdellovibrionales bacterium]MBT7668111.1 hypothetical protein [Bdellovibrionales bacterium]MBT7766157.1 hypothetical protein [Bdellovibrionales bacterium]
MKLLLISLLLIMTATAQSADKPQKRIIYKYKKYEKFDFSDLIVEGEAGSPGDLSISPRYQRGFKNKLPYRKNFNDKIIRAVGQIR